RHSDYGMGKSQWMLGTATFRLWYGKKSVDAGHGDIQIMVWEKVSGCRAPTKHRFSLPCFHSGYWQAQT
ncbi:MAG: hypothetical protein QNJ63_16825, partial [Calothrix sp. MO_192.B10]|nr:hypothetical protein [Calothrix sp. MO_192.B10]